MSVSLRTHLLLAGSAAVLALAAAIAPVHAQDKKDDEKVVLPPLTVTATKVATPISDVPATVSVITAKDIDDNLVTDIKDLVRYEPGVAVPRSPARFTAALGGTGRDGDSGFNIRGLEGNRVLILEDGIRVPDGFGFGAQLVGRGDYSDLDLMKTVEILRGPASALYGSDGVAGAVSFITKDPEDILRGKDWAAQAKASYTSADESWGEGLVFAIGDDTWQGMAAYTRRDGHGQETHGDNDSANTDRTTAIPQDIASNAFLGKILFTPDGSNRTRLTYEHMDRDVDSNVLSAIAKPPLGASSTLSLVGQDESARDRVSLDHLYTGDGFIEVFKANAYWQAATTTQFSAEDRNVSADRTRRNTFDNRVWGFGAEAQSSFVTGDISHHFVYGGDASFTHQAGVRDGTVPPFGETFPTRAFPTTDYTLAGFFVQDEIETLDGRLTLYPALRYDYYSLDPKNDAPPPLVPTSQSDSHLSPKLGGVFKFTDAFSAFANYAIGFKAPSPQPGQQRLLEPRLVLRVDPQSQPQARDQRNLRRRPALQRGRLVAQRHRLHRRLQGLHRAGADRRQLLARRSRHLPVCESFRRHHLRLRGEGRCRLRLGLRRHGRVLIRQGRREGERRRIPAQQHRAIQVRRRPALCRSARPVGRPDHDDAFSGKSDSRVDQTVCAPSCYTPPGFTIVDATAYWKPVAELHAARRRVQHHRREILVVERRARPLLDLGGEGRLYPAGPQLRRLADGTDLTRKMESQP